MVTCFTCRAEGHMSGECPDRKEWIDCRECRRPGHPPSAGIPRDLSWFCTDCQDPAWRGRLADSDPRYRRPGDPVQRPGPDPQDKPPALVVLNEPPALAQMTIPQMAAERAQLREPYIAPPPRDPADRELAAALRELARRQVRRKK